MRRLLVVLLAVLVFSPDLAEAGRKVGQPVKNPTLSAFAKQRPRGARGKFVGLGVRGRVVRGPLKGMGRANPATTGTSEAHIKLRPATGRAAGEVTVEIPEMYIGSEGRARVVERQLFAEDIHGKIVPITGTLDIKGGRTGFSRATFTGEIPAGAKLSPGGVERGLRSLQVHDRSVQWTAGE